MAKSNLSSVRVLDFTRQLAGPYSTLLLAFLGAEVVQVENPNIVEVMRRNDAAQCADLRLNKLSLGIDLTKPETPDIIKDLVRHCDLVVESFKAGTMAKMGIGYDVLSAVNPKLVMVSLSGMGQSGPEANYRAYAQIFGALGGVMHFTGYKDALPTELRASLDHRVGQVVSFAALAGLIHSRRTGVGQHIDVSARECLTSQIGDLLMDFSLNGRDKGPSGNEDVFMAPHNCYACSGDSEWVTIAVSNDAEWAGLCRSMKRPDLEEDGRFRTQEDRWQSQEILDALISQWTIGHSAYEVTEILQRNGVAAFPVLNAPQIFADPHIEARGYIREVEHPEFGSRRVFGPAWKFESRPAEITSRSPMFCEHNRHIMKTLLGKSDAEVAELESRGILIPGRASPAE